MCLLTTSTMKIERIAEPKGYSKKYTIFFAGGTRMQVEQSVIGDMSLHSGLDLSQEDMERLTELAGQASAKARAVGMLSRSSLSKKQLEKRLKERGESKEHTTQTVEWLEGLNLLDDSQVARQVVQSGLAKGYGKARLKQMLYEKGVEKSFWEEALADLPCQDDAISVFVEKRLARTDCTEKDVKRTVDALLRRGHNWSDIKRAIARYSQQLEDEL